MVEMSYLAAELRDADGTVDVECQNMIVKMRIHNGEYDAISSEIMSIIGRYDCSLYSTDWMADNEYWLVA